MPPWHASPEYGHFSNDARLTPQEKQTIAAWVAAGSPRETPETFPSRRITSTAGGSRRQT